MRRARLPDQHRHAQWIEIDPVAILHRAFSALNVVRAHLAQHVQRAGFVRGIGQRHCQQHARLARFDPVFAALFALARFFHL